MYGPIWPDFDAPWTLSWKNITRLWTFLVHAFLYNFCMVYCLCSCFLELKGRQKWQVYLHNEFVLWRLCYLQLVYWFLSISACSWPIHAEFADIVYFYILRAIFICRNVDCCFYTIRPNPTLLKQVIDIWVGTFAIIIRWGLIEQKGRRLTLWMIRDIVITLKGLFSTY